MDSFTLTANGGLKKTNAENMELDFVDSGEHVDFETIDKEKVKVG